MKALLLEISFFESFFKVHYTKGFKLTYPIPLPTSVAGIFGAMFGIERERLKDEFKDFLFGAKLLKYESIIPENITYLQYKSQGHKVEKGVIQSFIINEPTYLLSIAGEENKIKEIEKLFKEIKYIPYGGQNDFFVKDWKISGFDNVKEDVEVTNYAPQDWVKNIIFERGFEVQILPVRHSLSKNPNFYFIINGKLVLKDKVFCTEKDSIGLYSLNYFNS